MTLGPGRYDDVVTELRERLKARGIVLLVFGGARGEGFSAQLPLDLTLQVPELLETIARQIREDGGPLSEFLKPPMHWHQ